MPLNFEAKLPGNVPASAAVYRLAPVGAGVPALRATAKALGLRGTGGDVVQTEDFFGYTEGRHRLELHRASGAVVFQHRDKYGREPKEDFKIADRRADSLARAYLKKTKFVPVDLAELERVTHLRGASGELESREVHERVLDAGVVYRRTLDDLTFEGPGGFVMVNLDPDGEVIGLRKVWRPVAKREARVRLKKPDEAMAAFERHVEKVRGEVTVIKAGLGYFELGPQERQQLIEPAYSFVYVVRYEEIAFKSALVVHAGHKTFGRLIGKKTFTTPQQRRRG